MVLKLKNCVALIAQLKWLPERVAVGAITNRFLAMLVQFCEASGCMVNMLSPFSDLNRMERIFFLSLAVSTLVKCFLKCSD